MESVVFNKTVNFVTFGAVYISQLREVVNLGGFTIVKTMIIVIVYHICNVDMMANHLQYSILLFSIWRPLLLRWSTVSNLQDKLVSCLLSFISVTQDGQAETPALCSYAELVHGSRLKEW